MGKGKVAVIVSLVLITLLVVATLVLAALTLAKVNQRNGQGDAPDGTQSSGGSSTGSTQGTSRITTISGTLGTSSESTTATQTSTLLTSHWTSQESTSVFPGTRSTQTQSTTTTTPSPGWQAVSDLFSSSIDRTIDPCDDFYSFACNTWIRNQSVPDIDWFAIDQALVNAEAELAIAAIDDDRRSPVTLRSLKKLYDGCLTSSNDTRAIKIDQLLAQFGGWPILDASWNWTRNVPERFQDVSYTMAWLLARYNSANLLAVDIRNNPQGDYRLNIFGPAVTAGTCPDGGDPSNPMWAQLRSLMSGVTTRIADALNITLDTAAMNDDVDEMIRLEMRLCNASLDEQTPASEISIREAERRWPNIDWEKYFQGLLVDVFGYDNISGTVRKEFYIQNPTYIQELDQNLLPEYSSTDNGRRTLQNYLLWLLVIEYVQYTNSLVQPELDRFVRLHLADASNRDRPDFRRSLHGHRRRSVQFKFALSSDACLKMANQAATFAVDRALVDFQYGSINASLEARRRILDEIEAVRGEFKNMLDRLDWMDSTSKQNASEKLDYMVINALAPDWAMDDGKLDEYYAYLNDISADPRYQSDVFDMNVAIGQYKLSRQFQLIDGRRQNDRSDWGQDDFPDLTPLSVNAWYQLGRNSITVPSGIVRSPFYREDFPYSVRFGALGSVIGHEMTHGFDRSGQDYDEYGREGERWISDQSADNFDQLTKCVDEEYSEFCYEFPPPIGEFNTSRRSAVENRTICLNSDKTEEENLADNGGIVASYGAYLNTRPRQPEPPIPGFEDFTSEQIFFLSYATQWCERISEANLRKRLALSAHSPNMDRVLGTLRNFEEFGRTWKCRKGRDRMYPAKACVVW